MTDEPEAEDPEIVYEVPETKASVYPCDTCYVIFPNGEAEYAEQIGAIALRVTLKTGEIEIQTTGTPTWSKYRNPEAPALRPIK